MMPVFVSHYTIKTPYEKIVGQLIASLKRWKLDHDIEAIESLGSWRANSNYCAWQVQKMLVKHYPRPILRVDADAVVQQYPALLGRKKFHPDIAAAIWEQSKLRPDGEFMAGTIYFGNTEATKKAVEEWVRRCENRLHARNGDMLWAVIKGMKKNIRFQRLPNSFCKIYDFQMAGGTPPIIEHYQASRKCKGIVNAMGKNVRRK